MLAMTVAAGVSTAVVSLPFRATPSPAVSQTADVVAPLAVQPVAVEHEIAATDFTRLLTAVGTGVAEPLTDPIRLTLLLLPQRQIRQPE